MWLVFVALTYASEASANSRQGVQPFLMMYSTCLAIASSSRGGRKEKVSKNLQVNAQFNEVTGQSQNFGFQSTAVQCNVAGAQAAR